MVAFLFNIILRLNKPLCVCTLELSKIMIVFTKLRKNQNANHKKKK